MRVGLVSDTHGVLDARVAPLLLAEGVEAILHAGDIGSDLVLYELETVAPLTAVLGNCDWEIRSFALSRLARVTLGGVRFLVIHDLCDLGALPDDVDVVVCGHTHKPRNEWHGRVLVVNPGSASQRRRQPEATIGVLEIGEGDPVLRLLPLPDERVR